MFQTGGFPDLDLSFLFCPFCPFGTFPGIFPICPGTLRGFSRFAPFPLSRPIKSTYEEQSRKGPRHNLDLSRKSGKHPGLETPRFSFSQLWVHFTTPNICRKKDDLQVQSLHHLPAKSSVSPLVNLVNCPCLLLDNLGNFHLTLVSSSQT